MRLCPLAHQEFLRLVEFWISDGIPQVRRRRSEQLPELFEWLLANGLASEHDRVEFEEKFIAKQRRHVDLLPSIEVFARWDWKEAVALDEDNRLEREIRDAINEVFEALGEAPLHADAPGAGRAS